MLCKLLSGALLLSLISNLLLVSHHYISIDEGKKKKLEVVESCIKHKTAVIEDHKILCHVDI